MRRISVVAVALLAVAVGFPQTGFVDEPDEIAWADLDSGVESRSEWYESLYLSLSVGPQGREDAEDQGGVIDFEMGIVGNVGVGYIFPESSIGNLRLEMEWSRFHNSVDRIYLKEVPPPMWEDGKSTTIDINAFMASLYFDFNIGDSDFRPYVGFGAGLAQGIVDDFQTDRLIGAFAGGFITEKIPMNQDSSYVGAIQIRAGLSYELNDNFDIFAGYRYFETDKFTIMFAGVPDKPYARFHSLEFGLRVSF